MLRIVTGPFHPDLEAALVSDIRSAKQQDPFGPLLILVPSSHLVKRIKSLLAVDSGLSILNIHLLTFHQFALRLCAEEYGYDAAGETRLPLTLVDDLFCEYLLRTIGEGARSPLEALQVTGWQAGTWRALWATMRDLKDAEIASDRVQEAVGEGVFNPDETGHLRAVFALYGGAVEYMRRLQVGTAEDLITAVLPLVGRSPFLQRMQQVSYYGFYELTQVQQSLFEAVIRAAPVTLYFPSLGGPGDIFARRYFERHLYPLAKEVQTTQPARPHPYPKVVNAVGPEGEIAFVCREILELVETNGYAYSEIGVVARGWESYRNMLPSLFARHCIPFTTSMGSPVIQEPAVKVVLQLVALPLEGFYRPPVLDVMTSPFYVLPAGVAGEPTPRPDLWRLAAGVIGITRGEAEWRRLERIAHAAGEHRSLPEEAADGDAGMPVLDPVQCRLFWRAVSQLMAEYRSLPESGSPAALTEAFLGLVSRRLNIPGLTDPPQDHEESGDELAPVGRLIREAADRVGRLDLLDFAMRWEDWIQAFSRILDTLSLPVDTAENHFGVRILDAMAARGQPFRALFLLGLNDKTFPRVIREDPFLRDHHRQILEATLGYKINQKLTGYDEERLLFALLCGSARDRLYWLYQRADSAGRALAPSPLIIGDLDSSESLPRRFADRIKAGTTDPSTIARQDLAIWLALTGGDPSAVLASLGNEALLFNRGLAVLEQLEADGQDLGEHDGVIGLDEQSWASLMGRGISPTTLEKYARCPFQYFAGHVLRLEPTRLPVVQELEAITLGTLCHRALACCYQRLLALGWPDIRLSAETLASTITAAADQVFQDHEAARGRSVALLWALAKEEMVELIEANVRQDEADFRAGGFRPLAFEEPVAGMLDGLGLDGPIAVHGCADRIDRRAQPPALRVIDYKYKLGREKKPEDANLTTAAVRGYRLQPPLYARMTVAGEPLPGRVIFRFLAPRWDPPIEETSFDAAAWEGPVGRQITTTLRTLLSGIRSGQFFVLPDRYCDYCDFTAACRRLHMPTSLRAMRAAPAKALRRLRKQKAADA
jgi:ATP-dependent helicase/nuclease subunit B